MKKEFLFLEENRAGKYSRNRNLLIVVGRAAFARVRDGGERNHFHGDSWTKRKPCRSVRPR